MTRAGIGYRKYRDMTNDPNNRSNSPLGTAKRYDEPSVFTPVSLLGDARRQKDLPEKPVPDVCTLDPNVASSGTSSKQVEQINTLRGQGIILTCTDSNGMIGRLA